MFDWPDDVPALSDGRVRLRAHQEADLGPIVEMCQDATTRRWTDVPAPYGLADAEAFLRERVAAGWRAGNARGWAIETDNAEGIPTYAGNLDIRGGPAASVGFLLHPWARGRGVMSSALRLALTWSFAEAGIESVTWMARVRNVASRRVAWASGFDFVGTLPKQLGTSPLADAWIGTIVVGQDLRPRTPWLSPAVLRGEQLVLRPFTESDIPRIVEACSDARTKYWLSTPSPYTEESARTYLDKMPVEESAGRQVVWCVADADTDLLVANIAIFDLQGDDPSSGEVGYWTHPDARGRGVMTEAVRLVIDHALKAASEGGMGLRRIQLLAAAGNAGSAHIARRTGFVEVGRERQAELLGDGSYDDLLTFDILSGDILSDDQHGVPQPPVG